VEPLLPTWDGPAGGAASRRGMGVRPAEHRSSLISSSRLVAMASVFGPAYLA